MCQHVSFRALNMVPTFYVGSSTVSGQRWVTVQDHFCSNDIDSQNGNNLPQGEVLIIPPAKLKSQNGRHHKKIQEKYVFLNCSRYQSLPHVTNLIHKKCARYHRYHLHPLWFIEKSNRYQSLPHVTSLLHKIFSRCKQIGPKTGRHSLLQLQYIWVGQRLTGHCRIKLSHSMSQWTPSL